MQCCGRQCIRTNYSYICGECGVERKSFNSEMFLPGYQQSHSTMRSTTYSRRYRFSSLLLKTVNHNSGPSANDPIWKYLENAKNLKTHHDIQKVLSQTPFKNKRYCCLPCFAKVFTPDDMPKRMVPLKKYTRPSSCLIRLKNAGGGVVANGSFLITSCKK